MEGCTVAPFCSWLTHLSKSKKVSMVPFHDPWGWVALWAPEKVEAHTFYDTTRAKKTWILFTKGLQHFTPNFSGREAARVFLVVSFCCFCFPLLLCFAALFTPTRRGGPVFVRGIPPGRRTRPAPEWGPGGAIERDRLAPVLNFLGFFFASLCLAEGHRDPRDHFWGGRILPPQVPFSHARFLFLPQVFLFFVFFLTKALGAPLDSWTRHTLPPPSTS